MNKTTNNILMGIGVALGVGGAFLLGRSKAGAAAKDDIDEKKDEILEKNPGMDEAQALVEAATDVAEEALIDIREAEDEAEVPEKTTAAAESEEELEKTESDALLDPTNVALQEALAAAEAKAVADWADLIAAKKTAYESAIFALEKSLAATKIAVAEYDKAYENVVYYQDQLDNAKAKLRRLIEIRTEVWADENWALADAYTAKINELVSLINGPYQAELQNALNKLTPLIYNASLAISKTDNAIDLVAEYAREALNFELLLAMASRLTTVASATRTKLAELEEHLVEPGPAPEPTPVPSDVAPTPTEPVVTEMHHYSVTFIDGSVRTISFPRDLVAKTSLWDIVDRDMVSSQVYLGYY